MEPDKDLFLTAEELRLRVLPRKYGITLSASGFRKWLHRRGAPKPRGGRHFLPRYSLRSFAQFMSSVVLAEREQGRKALGLQARKAAAVEAPASALSTATG